KTPPFLVLVQACLLHEYDDRGLFMSLRKLIVGHEASPTLSKNRRNPTMQRPIPLTHYGIPASRLVLGCMSLGGSWSGSEPYTEQHVQEAREAVEAALEIGINMFDHADIYKRGKSERVFAVVMKEHPGLRERIILQSKVGIRFERGPGQPQQFDFS